MTLRKQIVTSAALVLLVGGWLAMPGLARAQSPSLSGTWQLSCPGRRGHLRQITLQIQQHGSTLSGSFSGPRRSGELSGTVQGDQVSLHMGDGGKSITFTGTTDGTSLTVRGPRGGSCSGARQ